jgi:hypothetical protein
LDCDVPLSREDELGNLPVKKAQNQSPHYRRSVIKLNSTFAESVDRNYAIRGMGAMIGGLIAVWFSIGLGLVIHHEYLKGAPYYQPFFFLYATCIALICFALQTLLQDAFTYTHYPIRFNRKNRQIYAFRRNGTVCKAAWDDVYFTLPVNSGLITKQQYVACHVLAEDKKTIIETFALNVSTAGLQGEHELRGLFEFYRRYMEKGPANLIDCIKLEDGTPEKFYCLPPIDKQRESWFFGWRVINAEVNGLLIAQILFQPFFFPQSFFRWLAMRTSKIPQWPQWVEDECQIEKDDPWLRDYYNNPEPKPW